MCIFHLKPATHNDGKSANDSKLNPFQWLQIMGIRRQTAEHPFGTIKYWMGSTHFLTKTLPRVSTEMSLHVLAYNLKRLISILGIGPTLAALTA